MDTCKIVNDHAALMRAEQERQREAAAELIAERAKWARARKQRARRRKIAAAVCYCSSIILGFVFGFAFPGPLAFFAAVTAGAVIGLFYTAWRLSSGDLVR